MNLIKTFEMMGRMSEVKRYSMVRMTAAESVLEHTGFVALLACLIAEEVNDVFIDLSGEVFLDVGAISVKALLHDVEEIVTGDTPRPTKYHDAQSKAMFERLENEGMIEVLEGLGLSDRMRDRIQNRRLTAKLGREGVVVALADLLAVVYKSWDEVILRSNVGMCKVASSTLPDLASMEKRIEENFKGPARDLLVGIIEEARKIAQTAEIR